MYYVYRYVHPKNPWLYVGRTGNLKNRIYDHEHGKDDNIDRRYVRSLQESEIYYIELDNKAQGIAVESYLIDKYKPALNKAGIYYGSSGIAISMSFPAWKRYKDCPKTVKDNFDACDYAKSQQNQDYKYDQIQDSKQILRRSIRASGAVYCGPADNANNEIPYSYEDIAAIFKANPKSNLVFKLHSSSVSGDIAYEIKKDGFFVDGTRITAAGEKAGMMFNNRIYEIAMKAPVTSGNSYMGSPEGLNILSERYAISR